MLRRLKWINCRAGVRGVAQAAVSKLKVPLVYVNMVGGQDDLVFDGGSFALNGDGALMARAR